MSSTHQKFHARIVEFRHLWLSIENFIGNAHLPLYADAQELSEFISDLDSQSNPLHAVIQESYRRAQCSTLNSFIDPFIVMDVLGESLFNQKNRDDVDVTLIDLIERIGIHISQKFIRSNNKESSKSSGLDLSVDTKIRNHKPTQTSNAQVINLLRFQKK